MRPYLLLFLLFFTACSPKIKITQMGKAYPALGEFTPFSILEITDTIDLSGAEHLGEIAIKEAGMSTACDYEAVKNLATKAAREMGGNCLQITEHRLPDYRSTCHRINAQVYRLSNPGKYEKEIAWHKKRPLQISDFKGSVEKRPFQAATSSTFMFEAKSNIMTGKIRVKARTIFYCDLSYFKRSDQDSAVLAHEQLHFDITEIYTRKFLQRLQTEVFTMQQLGNKKDRLMEEVAEELYKKQDEYDADVYPHPENQSNWHEWVAEQLETLAAFETKEISIGGSQRK